LHLFESDTTGAAQGGEDLLTDAGHQASGNGAVGDAEVVYVAVGLIF